MESLTPPQIPPGSFARGGESGIDLWLKLSLLEWGPLMSKEHPCVLVDVLS